MKSTFFAYCAALAVCVFLAPTGRANAQTPIEIRDRLTVPDSTQLQRIVLRDGSTIFGRVVSVNADTIMFQSTGAGSMQIPLGSIRDVKLIPSSDFHNGSYFPNPNATRLFFAPTGKMLKRGEGYVGVYELFFPGVAYGLTDNISIGGGVSLLPAAVEDQAYYLTPKIGFSVNDKVHLATGVLFVGAKGGTGGVYYGVGTVGDPNASVSFGAGYGFAGGKVESRPIAMAGGELRVSQRIAFVTENYLLPVSDNNLLYSFGLRFIGENLTTDLALFNVSGSNTIGLPFVDFVFRF